MAAVDHRSAMRLGFVALALGACWSAPPPIVATAPPEVAVGLPGVVWMTPSQPWRLARRTRSLASDGESIVIGSDHGRISRVDLKTGRIVAERRVADLEVLAIAALGHKRWIALAQSETKFQAYELSGPSLVATPIELAIDEKPGAYQLSTIPAVVVLDDGGVVITGRSLPLAIYDPGSWLPRTILDPTVGWNTPSAHGTILVASKAKTHRFDLATQQRTELDGTGTEVAATQLVAMARRNEGYYVNVWQDATKPRTTLPEPVEAFGVDRSGTRLVTLYKGQLRIHALPSGEVVKRIELGPTADGFGVVKLAFDDTHVMIDFGSVLRVVELAAGNVTSAGEAPWGNGNSIAVSNDGTLLVSGRRTAWAVDHGTVTKTAAYGELAAIGTRKDESRFVLSKGRRAELRTINGTVESWDLAQEPIDAWVGSDGAVVFDVLSSHEFPGRALHAKGKVVSALPAFHPDASLGDADVDAGDLVVALKGRIGLVHDGKPQPFELRMPECEYYGSALLEIGGKRLATWTDRELAIWDRTTGALLDTARFASDIGEVSFVPGAADIVVVIADKLLSWVPNQDIRTLAVGELRRAAVSLDGRWIGLGFGDGHVGVVDLVKLRAAMPFGIAPIKPTIPASCDGPDPFSEASPESDHDGDGCDDC